MKTKFSPGPWAYKEEYISAKKFRCVFSGKEIVVMSEAKEHWYDNLDLSLTEAATMKKAGKIQHQDFILISAAPTIYLAMKALVYEMGVDPDAGLPIEGYSQIMQQALKMIELIEHNSK